MRKLIIIKCKEKNSTEEKRSRRKRREEGGGKRKRTEKKIFGKIYHQVYPRTQGDKSASETNSSFHPEHTCVCVGLVVWEMQIASIKGFDSEVQTQSLFWLCLLFPIVDRQQMAET